jgi:hypothetical protein
MRRTLVYASLYVNCDASLLRGYYECRTFSMNQSSQPLFSEFSFGDDFLLFVGHMILSSLSIVLSIDRSRQLVISTSEW